MPKNVISKQRRNYARGKVSLYRGKECVRKNIPEQDAVQALLALIRSDQSK